MMLTSKWKKLPIGGLLAPCQALVTLSPRATPSSTDDHVAVAAFRHNPGLISLPNPTNHVPRPHDQHSQLVTRRPATRHGPPITVPIVHATVLVSPCRLATRTFSRGEEGLGPSPHFSPLRHLRTTGRGRERGRKVAARRAPHTIPHQSTSLLKRTRMNRNDASRLPNRKGLSKRLKERTASGYFQLVPVLELP